LNHEDRNREDTKTIDVPDTRRREERDDAMKTKGGCMFEPIGLPAVIVVLVMAAMALAVIWPAATICRRLGFSPLLGILAIVPLANLLLLWFVALAQWPRMREAPRSV